MVPTSGSVEPRRWTSQELLGGQREVEIIHGQDIYRLRCTRNGKLILHK
jgi:hemin uptake protein HemP